MSDLEGLALAVEAELLEHDLVTGVAFEGDVDLDASVSHPDSRVVSFGPGLAAPLDPDDPPHHHDLGGGDHLFERREEEGLTIRRNDDFGFEGRDVGAHAFARAAPDRSEQDENQDR